MVEWVFKIYFDSTYVEYVTVLAHGLAEAKKHIKFLFPDVRVKYLDYITAKYEVK